jgi:hypothetical protein
VNSVRWALTRRPFKPGHKMVPRGSITGTILRTSACRALRCQVQRCQMWQASFWGGHPREGKSNVS